MGDVVGHLKKLAHEAIRDPDGFSTWMQWCAQLHQLCELPLQAPTAAVVSTLAHARLMAVNCMLFAKRLDLRAVLGSGKARSEPRAWLAAISHLGSALQGVEVPGLSRPAPRNAKRTRTRITLKKCRLAVLKQIGTAVASAHVFASSAPHLVAARAHASLQAWRPVTWCGDTATVTLASWRVRVRRNVHAAWFWSLARPVPGLPEAVVWFAPRAQYYFIDTSCCGDDVQRALDALGGVTLAGSQNVTAARECARDADDALLAGFLGLDDGTVACELPGKPCPDTRLKSGALDNARAICVLGDVGDADAVTFGGVACSDGHRFGLVLAHKQRPLSAPALADDDLFSPLRYQAEMFERDGRPPVLATRTWMLCISATRLERAKVRGDTVDDTARELIKVTSFLSQAGRPATISCRLRRELATGVGVWMPIFGRAGEIVSVGEDCVPGTRVLVPCDPAAAAALFAHYCIASSAVCLLGVSPVTQPPASGVLPVSRAFAKAVYEILSGQTVEYDQGDFEHTHDSPCAQGDEEAEFVVDAADLWRPADLCTSGHVQDHARSCVLECAQEFVASFRQGLLGARVVDSMISNAGLKDFVNLMVASSVTSSTQFLELLQFSNDFGEECGFRRGIEAFAASVSPADLQQFVVMATGVPGGIPVHIRNLDELRRVDPLKQYHAPIIKSCTATIYADVDADPGTVEAWAAYSARMGGNENLLST